jgi:hypothetical protein
MDSPNLSSPLPRRTTAIFAKEPIAGNVKTRLCPPLRPSEAAALAEAMLADVVERLAASRGYHTCLYYAPQGARAWFRDTFRPLMDIRSQVGVGLGERLAGFFREELLGTVGSTAVAVGSDSPLIGVAAVCEAHDQLCAGADVVLGPDGGGGYFLIGMREPHTALVENVEMSTEDNLERTVELAKSLGLRVDLLAPGYDVDVERDLVRLRKDLAVLDADDPCYPPRTVACLERLAEAHA